ncbi:membrane protein required for colicin V production [Pseudoxanthomonas sp. GM95]|uniref:CvpA family protein n=1 Tax=Pseudoxanthomonas sp. GM95 TaxID=1881043 RepID=UPI0008CE456A|nr:CvpA family protein [Pseudoxanthomonas sp. GM95]SEK64916.1 membrane protein required for colicin V production [Pseudoxanthomonas sp. GM95]
MIDLVLGTVIVVSTLLGLLRGFVGIIVGTLSWLLAGWAAFMFGGDAATRFAGGARPGMTDYLGGYALTFVGVMIVVALIGMVIKASVRNTRLSGVDRLAGGGLGLVRGAFFACVLTLLMSFTPLTGEAGWRQSHILPVIEPGAAWMRAQLPDFSMPQMPSMPGMRDMNLDQLRNMDVTKLPVSGDNGALNDSFQQAAAQLPQLGQTVSDALGKAGGASSNGLPKPLNDPATPQGDPAKVRPNESDPARVVAPQPGQERPL